MENLMSPPPKKKKSLFGKIETREETLKVIKDVSNAFYLLAALQIILGYFIVGIETILDGAVFAVCAFLLRKFESRATAIILLLLSIVAFIITALNKFGYGTGGRNIFLAVIMIFLSVRAIQATFKLRKFQKI